ncbi:hypothetical protein ACVWZK_006381 [Bradyrhizobium sp. GM0.4]
MGITFGDHLIDSGYYDITPEQEREIEAQCQICGGDCGSANPPVWNCPKLDCCDLAAMEPCPNCPCKDAPPTKDLPNRNPEDTSLLIRAMCLAYDDGFLWSQAGNKRRAEYLRRAKETAK